MLRRADEFISHVKSAEKSFLDEMAVYWTLLKWAIHQSRSVGVGIQCVMSIAQTCLFISPLIFARCLTWSCIQLPLHTSTTRMGEGKKNQNPQLVFRYIKGVCVRECLFSQGQQCDPVHCIVATMKHLVSFYSFSMSYAEWRCLCLFRLFFLLLWWDVSPLPNYMSNGRDTDPSIRFVSIPFLHPRVFRHQGT